jgi:hypothetical protein
MAQNVPLDKGQTAIEPFFDATQELLSGSAPQFRLDLANTTTVKVVAAANANDQASVAVGGLYRFRTTEPTALASGTAGVRDIYVTASNNNFTGPPEDLDFPTDYTFGLQVRTTGSPPVGVDQYRKVGELDWDGSAITNLRQLVGTRVDTAPIRPTAPATTVAPIRARGIAAQTAPLLVLENSAGTSMFSVSVAGAVSAASSAISGNETVGGTLGVTGTTTLGTLNAGTTGLGATTTTTLHATGATDLDSTLNVDGAQTITANGGKTTLAMTSTGGLTGITFGGDTNIYRNSANELKTDDNFTVGGTITAAGTSFGADLTVQGNLAVVGTTTCQSTLSVAGATTLSANGGKTTLSLTSTGGTTGLTIGADTNLYREAANILATDDKLHVVGETELDGALNHDGTTIGFFGAAPVAQSTGWTISGVGAGDKVVNVDAMTLHELGNAFGTLLAYLDQIGLIDATVT